MWIQAVAGMPWSSAPPLDLEMIFSIYLLANPVYPDVIAEQDASAQSCELVVTSRGFASLATAPLRPLCVSLESAILGWQFGYREMGAALSNNGRRKTCCDCSCWC